MIEFEAITSNIHSSFHWNAYNEEEESSSQACMLLNKSTSLTSGERKRHTDEELQETKILRYLRLYSQIEQRDLR